MRGPVFCKVLALLTLLLVHLPAYGACACQVHCEDRGPGPCEKMSAHASPEGSIVKSTAMHFGQACHGYSRVLSDPVASPPSNELRGAPAPAATLPGWSADLVTDATTPARTACLWRADRSSHRYILFASFLS